MSINALPNSPSSGADSPNASPPAPMHQQAQPIPSSDATAARRKPSRRANTAERRATHNAVERARRETLNSRFLDLAALLPNLASVRRPSKSAIVNSSIALIHTQRRSRATAARELRILKAETDVIRHQLNELRLASGLGGLPEEEPPRSADFIALLNLEDEPEVGEDERVAYEMMEGEEDGLDGEDDLADARYHQLAQQQQALAPQPQQQFAPQQQHPISRSAVTYDAPAPIYDSTSNHSPTSDKLSSNAWNFYPGMQAAPQQQQQQFWAQHPQATHNALFTPPASSHGVNGAPPNPFANQAYVANYRRQAQQEQLQQHYHALNLLPAHHPAQAFAPLGHQTMIGVDDDNSSIGSGHDDSASGSPHDSQGSLPGYDMPVLSSSVSSSSSDSPFAYNPYSRRSSLSIPATNAWTSVNKSVPSLQPAIPHQFATMGLVMQ